MHEFPEAFDRDHLQECINANDSCPDIAVDEARRLIDLAERRAQLRGEDSALDVEDEDFVIATDWTGFASDEFGYDNGVVNQFAMGVLNESRSADADATLFEKTIVVQNGWLTTGDSRRSKVDEYDDEEFDRSSVGQFWVPRQAQDYIAIIGISPEAIHDDPDVADAM